MRKGVVGKVAFLAVPLNYKVSEKQAPLLMKSSLGER